MRRRAARVIVRLRFVILAFWVSGAVAAFIYLPPIEQSSTNSISAFLPRDTPAVRAERLSYEHFSFPLLTRTLVVRHHASGLGPLAEKKAMNTALSVRNHKLSGFRGLAAMAPVPNTVFGSEKHLNTILYYLYFRPEVGSVKTYELARGFAQRVVPQKAGSFVGVTGSRPATVVRNTIILDHLFLVTVATAVLVALAVGLFFRSPVAPAVSLVTVGVAYLIATRLLGWLGQSLGISVPGEVHPVVIVLLFGVVTDYSIFFLSAFRNRLSEGLEGREAVERGVADVIGIVLTAGLIVALATASLVAAKLSFFQVFGPAMGVTVIVGALVAVTFVPAALAIGGRFVLWPGTDPNSAPEEADVRRSRHASWRARVAGFAVHRPLLAALACILVLGGAASGLLRYDLANPIIQDLPNGVGPHKAYVAATEGFPTGGVVAPTVVVARGNGLAGKPDKLRRLKRLLADRPGVAAVLGTGALGESGPNAFVSKNGDFARFLVFLKGDPLDGPAVATVRSLEDHAPSLTNKAGLENTDLLFSGDTAITATLVARTLGDIGRVTPVALGVTFVVLALFLRSLVAPLYLLAANVLSLLAAFGLSAYLYGPLFGSESIPFFVPFASGIFLLALGSDYNVFITGRIWEQARRGSLREAVETADIRAARPIATAGLILAASFALLALVPLTSFRMVALTMALGLILDAFLVRQILVPALVVLVGRRGGWPGRKLDRTPTVQEGKSGSEEKSD